MIPENFVEKWRQYAKWQTPAQVEQYLIISRALADLYHDPHVSEALIFIGGTALNKLFLKLKLNLKQAGRIFAFETIVSDNWQN